MKTIKKIFFWLLIILLLLIAFIVFHMQSHTIVTTEEVVSDNEASQTKTAVSQFQHVVKDLQTTYAARGVHAKGHACVKAYFDVNKDIDPQLQYGVFQTPGKQYKSWVRFSNSSSNMAKSDDRANDARGMAIKLLNIDGKNLNGLTTQEFLAHNSPVFFVTDINDYNQFVASKGDPKYFLQGYNPFKWRLRELWQLITAFTPPPYSPIWTRYFSNTAYKLGPHNIKFMMQSCTALPAKNPKQANDPNFLKNTLAEELAKDSACMQLLVQLQDPTKMMPVEDSSVLWKEADSPFIPVAKITLLKQKFDSSEQQQFCENLSFSPWNSLEEHRPIGALNRVRRIVYEASSNLRHQINKTQVPQNLDW